MDKRIATGTARIEPRFILWRKIRFPLAVATVAVVLVATGLILWTISVSRSVSGQLSRATELAAADTLSSHHQARAVIDRLRAEHPEDPRVRGQHVWLEVLAGLRFGATPQLIRSVEEEIADAEGAPPSPALIAARAGLRLMQGDAAAALEVIGDATESPEERFVAGLALARLGRHDQALAMLDAARQEGTPPFLPALAELATLLRQQRRFDEAQAAQEILARASPGHESAVIESVLLALDRSEASPSRQVELAPSLARTLEQITLEDDLPRLEAWRQVAAGRLALIQGDRESAIESLSAAREIFADDQPLAAWLAVSYRRARRHEEALETLAPFADAPTTDSKLIRVKAEVLLDLQRTADAEAPLAVLIVAGTPEIVALEGHRLLMEGDVAAASPLLERALKAGVDEAALGIAEALMLGGQAHKAQVALRRIEGTGPLPLCASGYGLEIAGHTRRAVGRLQQAGERGGRCGAELAGRLLIGAGHHEELEARLTRALEEREDLRLRVALGRVLLRTKGLAAARAELDGVRSRRPQAALVLDELALAYDDLGLRDEAAAVAREGAERTGGAPMLVALAARYARESGDLDRGDRLLEGATKAHPSSPWLALERAQAAIERRRYDQAEDALDAAEVDGPTYSSAICARAQLLSATGERQQAQVVLARGAARAGERSGARSEAEIRACQVEMQLRRGPASIGRAKTSLHFLGQMPLLWARTPYLAGEAALRENRLSHAEEQFRESLELDPAFRESWRRLAGMDRLNDADIRRFQKIWPGQTPASP